MKNKKLIIILSILLPLLFISVFFIVKALTKKQTEYYFLMQFNDKQPQKVFLTYEPEIQKRERIITEITPQEFLKIEFNKENKLSYPSRIQLDKNNNIYVLDIRDDAVKKFDETGKMVSRFGRYGEGPGEIKGGVEFSVINRDSVYILDVELYRIVAFLNGVNKIYKLKNSMFHQLLPVGENVLVHNGGQGNTPLLSEIDTTGSVKIKYDSLYYSTKLSRTYGTSDIFTGRFFNYKGDVIFVSKHFNQIIRFNKGKMSYAVTTIDPNCHPLIDIKTFSDKDSYGFSVSAADLRRESCNRDAFMVDGIIYIWSVEGSKQHKGRFFDLYNAEDGKYIRSIKFNVSPPVIRLTLSKNRFALIDGDMTIRVYKY